MSKTLAIGVVGPSHWAYMARVMAEVLNRAVQKSCLVKTDIPVGVLYDAAQLSGLILEEAMFQETASLVPSNPPATINAYVIAKRAVGRVIGHYPNKKDTKLLISGCRLVVDFANQSGKWRNPEALRIIDFMSKFFHELSKMGEEERIFQLQTPSGDDIDE